MTAQVDLGNSRAGRGNVPADLLPVPSVRVFFLLLGLLFIGHIGLRLWISPIAEIDESGQLVLCQNWALGYHAQPPLYTWLQIVCFRVFGESIFAISLLKNGLLFALYVFTYASARLLTRRHDLGVFATLTLLLIPQISWESQRDLTHSVLLSTTMAATLFSFLWLAEKPGAIRYALLGACAGLALLSKHNSGVFLLGGVIAALVVPRYRAVLLDWRLGYTAAACLLVTGPHLFWAAQHADEAFNRSDKLNFRPDSTYGAVLLRVLQRIPRAALPNMLPVIGAYLLAQWRPGKIASPREWLSFRNDAARLIFWGSVISIALLSVGMIATKATAVRGRWFQPMFVCLPVLLVVQIGIIPRWLHKLVAFLAVGAVIAVAIVLPLNARGGGTKGQDLTPGRVANIIAGAGDQLRQADLLVADEFWVAGNMRLALGKPVILPKTAGSQPPSARRIVALFRRTPADQPKPEFKEFMDRYLGRPVTWRIIYLTPEGQRHKSNMPIGVAMIE